MTRDVARSKHHGPDKDIELATLWQAVQGGLKGLVLASALVGAITYGALSLIAPRYSSESQLEFVAKRSNPFPDENGRLSSTESTARIDQPAINTHARALLSSDLILKVAADLKMRNRPEFNSALGPIDTWGRIARMAGVGGPLTGESEDERVLSVVRRQLEVAAMKDTRFIAIRFNSTDNKLAAEFANRLAETYRGSLVSQPVEETSKVVEALTPKVTQLRREVLDAEAAVEGYRASSGQFKSGPQGTPVSDQRMAGLQDELLKAEASRNESDARWRTARELHRSGSAEVLPDVQKSALIQSLIQQRVRLERQIAEASVSLLPGHPRMQQLNADVAGLRRQITSEVEKVVQGIEKDARSSAIRVESVTKQIDGLKTTVVSQTGNEARLKEFESLARSKRTELERLQKQLEDNRTVVNIKQVPIEASLVARAIPSSTAIAPKKTASAGLASAATLILGLAFLITKALVTGTPNDVPERKPARSKNTPAPQREPAFDTPGSTEDTRHDEPLRPAAAAHNDLVDTPDLPAPMRKLAERLLSRTDMAGGVRTLVTPEATGRNSFAEARLLAEALSATGKNVLLVDWNLSGRLAYGSRQTGKPGITDLVCGEADFDNVITRLTQSNVHLIEAGSAQHDASIVLDPDRLNLALDALDEVYDQIVINADRADAGDLFQTLEGRFDAGIMLTSQPPPPRKSDGSTIFLGFEVNGIDVVHVAAPNFTRSAMPKPRMAAPLQVAT